MTAEARKKKSRLTLYIFIGMAVGLFVGWAYPDIGTSLRPLSKIFIRMIKILIAPLIFGTLVVGIAGHGDIKDVGRMGLSRSSTSKSSRRSPSSSAWWPSTS